MQIDLMAAADPYSVVYGLFDFPNSGSGRRLGEIAAVGQVDPFRREPDCLWFGQALAY